MSAFPTRTLSLTCSFFMDVGPCPNTSTVASPEKQVAAGKVVGAIDGAIDGAEDGLAVGWADGGGAVGATVVGGAEVGLGVVGLCVVGAGVAGAVQSMVTDGVLPAWLVMSPVAKTTSVAVMVWVA